jgi:dihydroneopterin aldolase
MAATLSIDGIRTLALIGAYPEERGERQPVDWGFSFTLSDDAFEAAAQSDNLEDTVDYFALLQNLQLFLQGSQFHLLEALLDSLSSQILAYDTRIEEVFVFASKPQAIAGTNGPKASLTRRRTPRSRPPSGSLRGALPDPRNRPQDIPVDS